MEAAVKMVVTVKRRKDLSHEQFLSYWCNQHADLVRILQADLRLKRYIQSPNIFSSATAEFAAARGCAEPCDGIAELWWASEDEMVAAFASVEGQRASALLAEDEARFFDVPSFTMFLSHENIVL